MTPTAAQRILAAVQKILINQGIEDVTIRNVATTAGVSIGAVQHHHRTKDELLLAAMDKVSEDVVARVTAAFSAEAPPRDNLDAVCRILGGVDDASRSASVIWLAYASKAATSEAVARSHRESWWVMEHALTGLLQEVDPGLGPDDAAMLMAVLDGVAISRATETDRMPPERAQHLIDRFLARLRP